VSFFFVHLYFCMFLLSLYGAPSRFSAIVKSDIFVFYRDSGLRKICKVILLTLL